MRRRCVHSPGNKGYNKTTESHLSRAPPLVGVAGSLLCKHRLPLAAWFSSPRAQSVLPNANGSLPPGQETSYAAREAATVGPGSGGCLGHRSGLRQAHKKVPVTAKPKGEVSPPCLHGTAPSVRFRHPPAEPPAQVGSIASRVFNGLARTVWPRGLPANPSKTQREPASAADALHSNRRRPVWSVALSPAPSRLREGPITATLGLGPRGPRLPLPPGVIRSAGTSSRPLRGVERTEKQLPGWPPTARPGEQLPGAPRLAPVARTHHTKSPSRRLTAAILPPNHHRRTGRREP